MIQQLFRIESADAIQLWDNAVAAAVDIEEVDKTAAHKRREVKADVLHGQSHGRNFIAVHANLHLW